jgi:hypothetical protein
MEDDIKQKLQRAAAAAIDPEDRAWAAAKYQELYGRAPAEEGVPKMLQRDPVDPLDAAMQRRQQEPQDDGMGSKVASAGKYLGSEMLEGLKGIGGMIYRPIANTPRSKDMAERGENLISNAADTFTLGAYSGLTDMAGITSPQGRAELAAKHPGGAMYGQGAGALAGALSGPARMLTEGIETGVRTLAPDLANRLLGRVGANVTAGAMVGGTQNYLESGGDLDATLQGVGGGSATSLVASGVPEGVRAARRGLQGASPWIGRYADAKDAGRLGAAEALPRGREGIQRASERARDDILTADEGLTQQAQTDYQAQIAPALGRPIDMSPVRRAVLQSGVNSRPASTGSPEAATPIVRRGQQVLDDLRVDPTVDDALFVRRGLDEEAAMGSPMPPTPEQRAARQMRGGVRQAIRDASPEVAQADDQFTQFRRGQERRNDILFRSEDGGRGVQLADDALEAMPAGMRQALRVGDEIKAAQFLETMGDESIEAMRRAPYFDELRRQHPAFGEALDQLMAKKALEATRLDTVTPQVRTNLAQALGQLPIMGGLLGGGTNLAAQYARGAGRFADQSLRNLQPAANLVPPLSLSLIDAFQRRREQEK